MRRNDTRGASQPDGHGDRVGETPIGNVSVPIGPHEIVFRHPELGELRHAATVTMNGPARVSVDLRKKQ